MKVLITSDWHLQPFQAEKFKTQKNNVIERVISWLTGGKKKKRKDSRVFNRMVEVIQSQKIKLVIHAGDLMENPQNERGLVTRKGVATARQIINSFCEKYHVQMELNAGNHELGYKLGLSTDPNGGISRTSIAGFCELVERINLYNSFWYAGVKFVFLPFLLAQSEPGDEKLNLKEVQNSLLAKFQADLRSGEDEKVILILHDPEALSHDRLYQLIRHYRQKIALIFAGHWHAQWNYWPNWLLANIFNRWWLYPADLFVRFILLALTLSRRVPRAVKSDYLKNRKVPARVAELGLQIIPAPLGMLGFGGGFLVLDLEDFYVKKY